MTEGAAGDPGAGTEAQQRVKGIVASALLVGGGSLVSIVTAVIRSKVISILVGAAGIGLQGILQSALKTVSAIAALGLQTSGVREIARLRGAGDHEELGHTLRALRSSTLILGSIAAVVLIAFHRPLGALFFDDAALGSSLAVLAIGVIAQVMYATYDAFLRGSRRVVVVTKAAVIANLLATVVGISLVYAFGGAGIVWALVAQPVLVLVIAAMAGRDLAAHLGTPDRARSRAAFARVVRVGIAIALTGFITTGAQLVARAMVARHASLDEVGYFQAAWAISVMYLGFVLGAMSQDYYPRLAEMGANRNAVREAVNEQAKVSFLLAGPAMLGLLTFSGAVVMLLYSKDFAPTVALLRWQLVGDVLKVGTWTLGYLVLAQGRPRVYFVTEVSWSIAYLVSLGTLLPSMGVEATAAAYVISSAVYFLVLCFITNRIVGFVWSAGNVALMATIALLAGAIVAAHILLGGWAAIGCGTGITIAFGLYCLRRLLHESGFGARLRRKRQ